MRETWTGGGGQDSALCTCLKAEKWGLHPEGGQPLKGGKEEQSDLENHSKHGSGRFVTEATARTKPRPQPGWAGASHTQTKHVLMLGLVPGVSKYGFSSTFPNR